MNTVSSNIRPNAIERLGNNTYYYNYNITSEQKTNQDGEEETIYNFIQVQLTGVPNYKDCIKNIIREYVSQTEEFDLINSYNKIQITGEKNSEDMKNTQIILVCLIKLKQTLREILTFELGLNVSIAGFVAPPSTTDSTTPPSKCVPGQDFYQIKRDQDYSSPSSILFYYKTY